MSETDKSRAVRYAVDFPRLTMPDLAKITGCSTSSLRAYRNGYRDPTAETVSKIADGLRSHAAAVEGIAAKLEDTYGSETEA